MQRDDILRVLAWPRIPKTASAPFTAVTAAAQADGGAGASAPLRRTDPR